MIFKIIRSKRRSVSLEIGEDASLIIRAPKLLPEEKILKLAEKKRNWIERQQKKALEKQQKINHLRSLGISSHATRHYKQQALRHIMERAGYFSHLINLSFKKIKITSARKRWGSCGSNGTLSFSWRLILTPPQVIDYVVAHEVAHLAVGNHSKKFWKTVANLYPEYKTHQKWIKENSHLLAV